VTVPPQPPLQQQPQHDSPTQQFPPHPGAQHPPAGAPWGPPPGNQWGPPPQGPHGPHVPSEPQNGFGIAAIVLGVLALGSVGLGLTPVLPFVGLIVALLLGILALVFGLLGMARARRGLSTNKPLSVTGLVLGVIAMIASIVCIVLGILAAMALARELESLGDSLDPLPSVSQPSTASAPSDSGSSAPPAATGSENAFEWEDGVSVEVSEPSPVTFSDTACCPDDPEGVSYTVKIVNGSDESLEPISLLTTLTADGVEADRVFDSAQDYDTPIETLRAGEELTYTLGFAAKPDSDLVLEISSWDRDPAIFRSGG
jgi:hypothetical protein